MSLFFFRSLPPRSLHSRPPPQLEPNLRIPSPLRRVQRPCRWKKNAQAHKHAVFRKKSGAVAWTKIERQCCGSPSSPEPPAHGRGGAWGGVAGARPRGSAQGPEIRWRGAGTRKASRGRGYRVRRSENAGSLVCRELWVTSMLLLYPPERWEPFYPFYKGGNRGSER